MLSGILQILSCFYLAFVITFVLGMNESDDWKIIFSSAIRRWLKLVAALLAIAAGVHILGS